MHPRLPFHPILQYQPVHTSGSPQSPPGLGFLLSRGCWSRLLIQSSRYPGHCPGFRAEVLPHLGSQVPGAPLSWPRPSLGSVPAARQPILMQPSEFPLLQHPRLPGTETWTEGWEAVPLSGNWTTQPKQDMIMLPTPPLCSRLQAGGPSPLTPSPTNTRVTQPCRQVPALSKMPASGHTTSG